MTEYAGFKTQLEVELGAVWTPVAQIVDLDGPEAESDQIEVSHRDDQWRRFVAGMKDGGEVSFDVIFDPDHASHDPTLSDSMWGYLNSGERVNFRLTFPGVGTATTTAAFVGFVRRFQITSPMEDGLGAALTIKISGLVTWAHVAGT